MLDSRQLLKQQITNTLIEWHATDGQEPLDYSAAIQWMWFNHRPTGGLRLSDLAYSLLSANNVAEYMFELDDLGEFSNNSLFLLDKKMQFPYYLHIEKQKKTWRFKRLIIFGSEESMMLALHGDLNRFLELL